MQPSSVHQLSVGNSNPKFYTQTRDKRLCRLSLVCVCPDVLVSVRIALSLSPVPFSCRLFPSPATTQCFVSFPLRRLLVPFRLFPSPAATQGFSLFCLRRVQRFVVPAFFPAATQVYSAFCLRRLLVPFRLCPSPATTQGFFLFCLRRVQRFVVPAFFPAATQVYSAFCLRRFLVFVLCFVCLLLIIAYNDCKVVLGNTMHLPICSFDRLCLARSDSAIFMHLDT